MTGPPDEWVARIVAENQVQVARLKAEAEEQTARLKAALHPEDDEPAARVCRDCRLDDEPLNETGRCRYCADLVELQDQQNLTRMLIAARDEQMPWAVAWAWGVIITVVFFAAVWLLMFMLPGGGP